MLQTASWEEQQLTAISHHLVCLIWDSTFWNLGALQPCHTVAHRVETFTPPYILGTRPAFADNSNPSMVLYGSTFNVTLAANTSSSSIRSVVLMGAPSVTHSSAMGARHHPLQFMVVSGSILSVTAPRTPNDAPPCECWQLQRTPCTAQQCGVGSPAARRNMCTCVCMCCDAEPDFRPKPQQYHPPSFANLRAAVAAALPLKTCRNR